MPVGPGATRFAPPPLPGVEYEFGANGPQPYDYAPEFRLDAGHLFAADAEGRPGSLAVTEIDAVLQLDTPLGLGPGGGVFTFQPEYRGRYLDGPGAGPGDPPLPGDLHRLGAGFEFLTPKLGPWSARVGFTPAVATDFKDDLTDLGTQYDARGALFYDARPDLTLIAGVQYWDRADDQLLPWAGVVYRPGDRWEYRLTFPDARVSYFYGPVWGKPMWVYAGLRYNREAYQFSPGETGPADGRRGAVHRLAVHPRRPQGSGLGRHVPRSRRGLRPRGGVPAQPGGGLRPGRIAVPAGRGAVLAKAEGGGRKARSLS